MRTYGIVLSQSELNEVNDPKRIKRTGLESNQTDTIYKDVDEPPRGCQDCTRLSRAAEFQGPLDQTNRHRHMRMSNTQTSPPTRNTATTQSSPFPRWHTPFSFQRYREETRRTAAVFHVHHGRNPPPQNIPLP
ncbi:hypothetical protein B5807_03873 [Epicoccum nigrum]|uniref:Uncharacterized protein n=1 Tax=Epicoccum nigrum TaxID=105696 RepID=A0A1Y2M6V8_EPING|nr:hypothetical protein B5807_03873 [Epicoccum nigrum]